VDHGLKSHETNSNILPSSICFRFAFASRFFTLLEMDPVIIYVSRDFGSSFNIGAADMGCRYDWYRRAD